MSSKKDYTKDIIEEYNLRFQSWGNSDSWRLTEFKLLEDMILESSGARVDANTLKRFFQQRTSNPQTATINALCVVLGYASYSDFIVKKTAQNLEETELEASTNGLESDKSTEKSDISVESTEKKLKKEDVLFRFRKRHLFWIIPLTIIIGLGSNWKSIQQMRKDALISKATFTSNVIKGTSPLTVKFDFSIPPQAMDSIFVEFKEPNGDLKRQKLIEPNQEIFFTYIYTGRCLATLKYGKRVIKTMEIETRKFGWSSYVRDDQIDYFQNIPFEKVSRDSEGITLSKDNISKEVDTEKLFVSYTYYSPEIIDGDNFIFEAKIRNSPLDNGIPCYDVMMYAFSDSLFHCFSLNNSCYSYLKFISSEKIITGENHDLSKIYFNSSNWHIMRIEVKNKQTSFILDGKEALKMKYDKPIGMINELTLRFKGCGRIQYVKVLNLNNEAIYEADFSKENIK